MFTAAALARRFVAAPPPSPAPPRRDPTLGISPPPPSRAVSSPRRRLLRRLCAAFVRSGRYGVYHSTYDSYDWVAAFGGGGADGARADGAAFDAIAAAARVFGLLGLRLADSTPLVPLDPTRQAAALVGYIAQLRAYNETTYHR